jgi:hypothetical protein
MRPLLPGLWVGKPVVLNTKPARVSKKLDLNGTKNICSIFYENLKKTFLETLWFGQE